MRYMMVLLALVGLGLGVGVERGASESPGAPVRVAALISVAGIELGPDRGVATPYLDFHSSGNG